MAAAYTQKLRFIMFQLSPFGLGPDPRKKVDRGEHYVLESAIVVAIQDIIKTNSRQQIIFNLKHPDTKALLMSLDAFFNHGLLRGDCCYWRFVEQFIPICEQELLQRQWNCKRVRHLSIAWLKDSLNRSTLHFQLLAFGSSESRAFCAKWYHKNACIRNPKILQNICDVVERLNDIKFDIERPYIFRTEDVPIAQPTPSSLSSSTALRIQSNNCVSSRSQNNGSSPAASKIGSVVSSPPLNIGVVANGAVSTANNNNKNGSVDVTTRRLPLARGSHLPASYSSFASIPDFPASNSHLTALTRRLPEVEANLADGVAEHSYTSTMRDQNYVMDELLQIHRIHGYLRQSETSTSTNDEHERSNSTSGNNGGVDEASNSFTRFSLDDDEDEEKNDAFEKQNECELDDALVGRDDTPMPRVNELAAGDNAHLTRNRSTSMAVPFDDSNNNNEDDDDDERKTGGEMLSRKKSGGDSSSVADSASRSGTHAGDDENALSDVDDNEDIIGIIPVDSGEIVHLAMEIFRDDGERFQNLFQVYLGHSAGQPLLRHLTVTDQFVYFLSTVSSAPRQSSSSADGVDRSSSNNRFLDDDHYAVKYVVHITIPIADIAYITLGIDAQVFCIHLKKRKHSPAAEKSSGVWTTRSRSDSKTASSNAKELNDGNTSSLINEPFFETRRLLAVDSGSRELTKFIVRTLRQTYAMKQNSGKMIEEKFDENSSPQLPVFTKSTQLTLIIERFLKQELKMVKDAVEVVHLSLVYWIEVMSEPEESKERTKGVEGYLNVRRIYPKSWVRRNTEWEYSYFVFMGCMLYQFSDSSCKFAQRAYNVREKITQVYEADIKDQDGLVFQLELDDDGNDNGAGGALQFKCPTQAEMKKWMDKITIALSISNEQAIPVACQFILTGENAIFAQEGANCAVDGFMRALGKMFVKQVIACFSVHTEFHNVLVIERENAFDYLLLRDERELKRLAKTLLQSWGITVEENEENSSRPEIYNQIFRYCARLSALGNLWMCNSASDK